MKYLRVLIFSAAVMITQCKNPEKHHSLVKYDEKGRQLLSMNELSEEGAQWEKPMVAKSAPDSISLGDEFRASIYLKSNSVKIVEAYFGCDSVQLATVDTVTFEVSGCSKKLYMQSDTLIIGFRPSEIGEYEFPKITLLTLDQEKIFRTLDYKFSYKVVAR